MKKKQKKYSLTFDEILEITQTSIDCELCDNEITNYVKAFLFDISEKKKK